MEFVTPIITPIIESLMVPVKKHLGFFFSSTKYVTKMNERLQNLNETKHVIEEKEKDASRNDRLIPDRVPQWLEQVKIVNDEARTVTTGGNGCLNLKIRYKAGKTSFNIVEKIDKLIDKQKEFEWDDKQRPLAMVISPSGPSASEIVYDHDITKNIFRSRKRLFDDVLKLLEADSQTQMVGLWGMGGVGKTTMIEDIEKVVKKRGMFKWVVRKTIGTKYDPINTQEDIAKQVGVDLTEETIEARVVRLGKIFEGMSKNGEKILVILDDVWKEIKLKDIGLASPFPKGFKLLVTSRNERVCTKMNVETKAEVFKMVGIEEAEANSFFWKTVGISYADGERRKIGEDILKKCGGLPIAIKTIAEALKDEENDAWEVAHKNLQRHNLKEIDNLDDVAVTVFRISYKYLKKDDDKAIFVLCGLFQDDFDISLEELVRYGWGLQLFMKADSLDEARKRTNTSIRNLIRANLLTESYTIGCVKMHDLARAFVLDNILEFKQASIVNHGDKSEWPTQDTRVSCERILLTCKGMSEFPEDFYYPNVSLLKIMDGNRLLKLLGDFHKRMEKLKVIAYDKMQNPLFISSLQCSSSLRTVFLDSCSLVDNDISFLGKLVNLEVLSLAHCNIRKLASSIGKLKRLKLLDLTGCVNLCIDDHVLQNLKELEELYMTASENKPIRFTDANCDELKMLSDKLIALEFEFFENILQPKNLSFKKLQRFRMSMGCSLNVKTKSTEDKYSFKNTLDLTTNISDILDCKISELFSKTEKLHLSVKDMICVEDIMSQSQNSTFSLLKVLHVSNCPCLTHLFTIPVANGLKLLESLTVSSCPALKSLVSLPKGERVMELPELVELKLYDLRSFTSIIPEYDISTTQQLFDKEVVLPKLSNLIVDGLKKLKRLWADDITSGEEDKVSMLREIEVVGCDSLVSLFPRNPMRLLSHLEEITVKGCCTIEVLFNINLGETEQHRNTGSLRRIRCENLEELTEVWRINDENNSRDFVHSFKVVDTVIITSCKKFRNVFTPTTVNFDTRSLMEIYISFDSGDAKVTEIANGEDDMSIVAYPSYHLTHTFHYLRKIEFSGVRGVEVMFEIQCPSINREMTTAQQQQPLLPYLQELNLYRMDKLSHVWKCNKWNELFILHKHQAQSSFQNLTSVYLEDCNNIKYLFSPLMSKLLSSLKTLGITNCRGMEEVVLSKVDEEEDAVLSASTYTLFPCLDAIYLQGLDNLKNIGGVLAKRKTNAIHDQFKITEIAKDEDNMSIVAYPSYHLSHTFHDLHKIEFSGLRGVEVMFEMECPGINRELVTTQEHQPLLPYLQELNLHRMDTLNHVWKCNNRNELYILHKHQAQSSFQNLTNVYLEDCNNIKYLFSPLMSKLLLSLKTLGITNCRGMEEIVLSKVDDDEEDASTYTLLPRLDYIDLRGLDNLKHIGGVLAKWKTNVNHDQLKLGVIPSCTTTQMHNVQNLTIYSCGSLVGVFESEEINNINDCSSSNFEQGSLPLPRPNNITMCHDLANLESLDVYDCDLLEYVFTFSTLESLKNLKELWIRECKTLKVIVREENEEESSKKIVLARLKSIQLENLPNLEGFFLGKNVDFQWPSLDSAKMKNCPQMKVFTNGESTAPNLKCIHTRIGKHNLECGLNFHQTPPSSSSLVPAIAQGSPFSFTNLVKISLVFSSNLKKIIPSNELLHLQNLEEVSVHSCDDVEEVFELTSEVTKQNVVIFPKLRQVMLFYLPSLKYIWKSNRWTRLEFPHLTILVIDNCESLEYVFTPSMVGSLMHLQKLYIYQCYHMEVIIKKEEEEECDGKVSDITLPCLQSLILIDLPRFKGVCLRKDNFTLSSLDTLVIQGCPEIRIFTEGSVIAPELKVVETSGGFFQLGEDINSFIMTKQQEESVFGEIVLSSSDEDE